MKIGSLFSGIGGIDLAFERAGFTVAWQVEWNKGAQSVLRQHWSEVPLYGDITEVATDCLSAVDVVCGGSPCQSFSVAGSRAGLDGASGLFWHFIRVADSQPDAMVLWENVPGVLSSQHGHDFALILWAFTGYYPEVPAGGWRNSGVCVGPKRRVAWGVLDAQYFGVPQRRRRVFLVGDSGGGGNPLEILFESESLRGHPPTRRKAGQIAPSLLASGAGANRPTGIGSEADFCIPVADTLTAGSACSAGVNPPGRRREDDSNLVVSTVDVRNMVLGADISGTLQAKENGGYSLNYINPVLVNTTANALTTDAWADRNGEEARLTAVAVGMAVRRLMPIETERLQGLPDDWTRYDADGKELSDSARYRLVGNSVAVPVVAWIARRMANAVTALTPTPAVAPVLLPE